MATGVRYDDRMSPSDALLWNNERDPMLRSTIVSVMLLDRPPDESRLAEAIDRSLDRIPRLRQRVVLDPLAAAPPRWERDPLFDLRYHLRRLRAPRPGSMRQLLDLAAPIAMQAFDKDRPLWELHQVDDLEDGRTAVLIKLHHAVSDGVGLVRMTSSLVERSREPRPPQEGYGPSVLDDAGAGLHGPFEEALDALRYRAEANLRALGALQRSGAALLRHPVGALGQAGRTAASLTRLLRPVREPLSPLMRGRSLGVRFDVLELPLQPLKAAAKAANGTLNDAFVAAVTGGLRRYHERHGRPADALRMTMPISVRQGERGHHAGNQFIPARFPVPLTGTDPRERMKRIHELVAAQRGEPALPLFEAISSGLSRLPAGLSVSLFGSMLKAVDFVTSNVPGPPFPVYASGALVERMFGFGPLSGAAANVVLFSYDGRVHLSINTDPAAVPDPDVFVACLQQGLDEVLAVA